MSLFALCLTLRMVASAEAPPAPSTGFTWLGGRGLSQTRSAEGLGSGVLVLGLRGAANPNETYVKGWTPPKDAMVGSVLGSVAFGANSFIDFSAWSVYYSVSDWDKNPNAAGFGASGAAAKVSLPLDPAFPLRLGFQAGVIAGAAADPIHQGYDSARKISYVDGYTYFENRTGYDFEARFLQTLRMPTPQVLVELHANEGLVATLQDKHGSVAVIDLGLAVSPGSLITLGLEGHLRTIVSDLAPLTDPLWATASIDFHIPRGPDLLLGADISASGTRERTRKTQALDSWRIFGGLTLPLDLGAEAREARNLREQRNQAEKDSLKAKAELNEKKAAELEAKAAALETKAAELAEKARQDSIAAVTTGRRADTLDAQRKAAEKALEEERARSNGLENELLEKGLIALDAVFFQNGKSSLTASSKPYLKLVGSILAKYPKLMIEVGGHTDSRGRAATNMRLSKERASEVRLFLISEFPTLRSSLVDNGYGSSQPRESNSTAEGREQNRRVELRVLNPEILPEIRKK
ncbi:MAG: OmpA family protein [Fibrobacteria bacterium]|nr:OmpA family protein [Fibrobacteria bacterium]